MFPVLLLSLYMGMASAAPTPDPSLEVQWLKWKTKYGKTYNTSEEEHRRAVWEENMQMIELHNREYKKGNQTFTMKMNAFGDMTFTEFWNAMSGFQIEMIKTGKTIQQYTADQKKMGIFQDENDGPCRGKPQNYIANVTGLVYLTVQEAALMNMVKNFGPLCTVIDAKHASLQFYKNGIFYDSSCSDIYVNHAVLLVAFGFEEDLSNSPYWLIENSWGLEWGVRGFMKLARNRNNHCGIGTAAINSMV